MESKKVKRFLSFEEWYYRFLLGGLKKNASKNLNNTDEGVLRKASSDAKALVIDDISELYTGDKCLLCSNDSDRHNAEGYANTDMASAKPTERTKDEARLLGIKQGTVMPITVSCCKRCKRKYLVAEYLPTVVTVILLFAAFLILSDRDIREPLMRIGRILPAAIFLGTVAVSLLLSMILRRLLVDVFSKTTRFDIFTIEKIRTLKASGWSLLYAQSPLTKLIFSKELPNYLAEEVTETVVDVRVDAQNNSDDDSGDEQNNSDGDSGNKQNNSDGDSSDEQNNRDGDSSDE